MSSAELEKIIDQLRLESNFTAGLKPDLFCLSKPLGIQFFTQWPSKRKLFCVLPEMTLQNGFADFKWTRNFWEAYRNPRVWAKMSAAILSRLWLLFQKNKAKRGQKPLLGPLRRPISVFWCLWSMLGMIPSLHGDYPGKQRRVYGHF